MSSQLQKTNRSQTIFRVSDFVKLSLPIILIKRFLKFDKKMTCESQNTEKNSSSRTQSCLSISMFSP
jgi:hypothetical protein